MTTTKLLFAVLLLPIGIVTVDAEQPPRPVDTARSVTLSLGEFNRLIDLAGRPAAPAPAPVPGAAVSNADLRIRVDRDSARGAFTLSGDVLQQGVARVGLVSSAGTVLGASSAAGPVPLVSDRTGVAALLSGPGPFALALDWGSPLAYAAGRAWFAMPVPHAGSARAVIDLPGDQSQVHLSAGLITRRTVENGRTLIEATLDPGSMTEVSWTTRDIGPAQTARESRLLAEVMTLVTVAESDVRMVALVDVAVLQGAARTIALHLPSGYEVTGVTGNSLESIEQRPGGAVLTIATPAARGHQFLVSLERPYSGGSFTLDTGLVSVIDAQRERGEVAIEGVGTLDLRAEEREGLQRIDVRELNPALQTLARLPLLSAFRYQGAAVARSLSVSGTRFADAAVLGAVADHATVTTLVTSEGRALTEVILTVQNRAQPYMRVALPPGATIVSVHVAGEPVKNVLGSDGARVPLRRAGLNTRDPYEVSFVYLHAGTPFARKGDIDMALPKMDVPIGLVNWEVFVPHQYSTKSIGGNALDMEKLESAGWWNGRNNFATRSAPVAIGGGVSVRFLTGALPGQIRGRVIEASGGHIPGAEITVTVGAFRATATSDANGQFVISNVPSGDVKATASLTGFQTAITAFAYDGRPRSVEFTLGIGQLAETVIATGALSGREEKIDLSQLPPSSNVVQLQQRASGVLPIRIDVPKAGRSLQFAKPLVVDQETTIRLRYKRR